MRSYELKGMYGQMGQVTVRHLRYRRSRGAYEISRAFGGSPNRRHLPSAKRRAVAGVFDVAAHERPSVSAFDRRADIKSWQGVGAYSPAQWAVLISSFKGVVLFASAT
jgi:hypothetical protein